MSDFYEGMPPPGQYQPSPPTPVPPRAEDWMPPVRSLSREGLEVEFAERWEYRVIPFGEPTWEDILNRYGLQGWELVTLTPANGAVMKRPITGDWCS